MSETGSERSDWTTVAFGDVVRLSGERSVNPEAGGFERFVGLEHIDPDDLRIRRWGDTADGTTFTTVFQPGQVLFGKRRAYQRKVAVADFSGVCSGDIYVLEPKGKHLLPELLPFICQTDAFFEHAVGTSAGSLSPRTNWNHLATFKFALPPVEEQRRLLSVMSASFEYVHSLEDTQRALADTRMALIYSFEESVRDSSKVTLASLGCYLEAGKSPPSSGKQANPVELGVLKVSAVGNWEFVGSENKVIAASAFVESLQVVAGDLLVARANADPDSVGRSCIVQATRSGLMLSDKTWRLQLPDEAAAFSYGMLAWTKCRAFRRHIRNHLNGTDAKNISQDGFLSAVAPVIDSRLHAFDESVRSVCRMIDGVSRRWERALQYATLLLAEAIG